MNAISALRKETSESSLELFTVRVHSEKTVACIWMVLKSPTSLIIRKIQMKTTMRYHLTLVRMAMRYHLTLVRMAIINKSAKNTCWRG